MSVKKAQNIVNEVEDRMGIALVSFQNNELEWLKDRLEKFLDLEIETDELSDPEDLEFDSDDNYGRNGRNSLSHDSDDGEDDF